ncbi:hypothetical protein PISMIDRAFT_12857 [Pisolithus microcarpus 441]|uniref:Uncharacterized protein n=1 Tax=Pisolithus microcarpus 441 TaxID=765257 RepID=A0A0C9Z309_9AGAM|nr:hypothetical protein BKA83DRAFT_12857 [Pisolithus microcarpus]KIK20574.1 hypothetical protein PISMIDRAFT_12857 [Pisolithus microcarpus 441]
MPTNFGICDMQATNTGEAHCMSLFNKGSDDIFHLSPFPHLHDNTISLIYLGGYHPNQSSASKSDGLKKHEETLGGDGEDAMSDAELLSQELKIVVPPPNNSEEAYLLLEAARAN